MDPALMIPIIAISIPIVAILSKTMSNILQSQERRLEMRLRLKEGKDTNTQQQFDALRKEIAALRDTSTQFDVSFDHTLHRLESRVQGLEKKSAQYPTATIDTEEQTVQAGRG